MITPGMCRDCDERGTPCPRCRPCVPCKQCGAEVEEARRCYATPVCYACLPPPEPLEVLCVAGIDGVRCTCPKCRDLAAWARGRAG